MSDVRILIVDDNSDFSYLLELSLDTIDGCRVVGIAEDGRSALEAVRRLEPDVVLLDIALPETDGFEILRDIGKMTRSPLVFVMSAIRSREIGEEAVALGAAHYFIKPIDLQALTRIIRDAFGGMLGASEKAAKLLHTLKIPPGSRGFKYLKAIIVSASRNEMLDFGALVRRCAAEYSADATRFAARCATPSAWHGTGTPVKRTAFCPRGNEKARRLRTRKTSCARRCVTYLQSTDQ